MKKDIEVKIEQIEKNQKATTENVGGVINILKDVIKIQKQELKNFKNIIKSFKRILALINKLASLVFKIFWILFFLIVIFKYDEIIIDILIWSWNYFLQVWTSLSESWQTTFFSCIFGLVMFLVGRKSKDKKTIKQ